MKPAKPNNLERTATAAGCKIAESVGALLKKARLDLGCNRREAASRMKIPERYIAYFEDGAYDKLPEDVYSRIYLKVYCKFLGLDTPTVLNLHRQERTRFAAAKKSVSEPVKHPAKAIPALALVTTPHLLRNLFLLALAAGLGAYLWWALQNIVTPPAISLTSPSDGLVTTERTVVIEGQTEREVALRINGKYVAPDDNGNFRDFLELRDGLNVIKVIGTKKHSREAVITRRIIVQPKVQAAAPTEKLSAELR